MEGAHGFQLKGRRIVVHPVDDGEPPTPCPPTQPCTLKASFPGYNNQPGITKQNDQLGLIVQENAVFTQQMSTTSLSSEDEDMVVDMGPRLQLKNIVTSVRENRLSEQDCNISLRKGWRPVIKTDATDLQIQSDRLEEPEKKQRGILTFQAVEEILSKPQDEQQNVFFNDKVLNVHSGLYLEDQHYRVFPNTLSSGAFGVAAKCWDLATGTTFVRKKVRGQLCKNEVIVPLMFKGNMGITEIYGFTRSGMDTEIFQEYAGLSLRKLCESDYVFKLRDPVMLMTLAFQAYATLDILHSQGVTHQDIKPENVCVDMEGSAWRLKFIDFGSSQTVRDHVLQGLTNEYLSPESCQALLQVSRGELLKEQCRLEAGADVWAMALTLLYCLCGFHLMVFVCTGHTMYQETDAKELQDRRSQCIQRIAQLTDKEVKQKLIRPDWPSAVRELLENTLRVNPSERWSAKKAAHYILSCLKQGGTAAGQKAAAPEPPSTSECTPRLKIRAQAFAPQTQVFAPQAQVFAPQAQVFAPRAQVCTPQAQVFAPQAQVCAPQAQVFAPQAQICTPQAQVFAPQAQVSVPQAHAFVSQAQRHAQPVQCIPAPSPASVQLPAFEDLLPSSLNNLAPRPYKRRHAEDHQAQPARMGHKLLKK